jgi:Bacteriophage minor capsid protein
VSVTTDLLTGLSAYVTAHGVTAPGYMKGLPTTPDRCFSLTAYSTSDEVKIAAGKMRVQFWFRGIVNNSLDVDELGDSVFDLLQGAEDLTFGTAHVAQIFRVSSMQHGADANKRNERSDNYELDVDVPVTPGRPW